MVYDDDTKMTELLMEAISFLSDGKSDLARAEADPLFKLLKFNGDADQMDREWVSWTTSMLSVLELHEVVKSYDVSLAEVEEWVNDLRIWYERANLGEEKDSKRGKKRSLERESSKDIPAEKEVVETSETEVAVEEEMKKVKKKRKAAAIEDPYTLLVPKPKKMPANIERGGSSSNAVVSAGEKASKMRTKSNVGGKTKKKEKSQSPKKEEVVMVQGPEEKDRPSDVDAPASTTVNAELGQSCQAIEDAKREGLVSSIQGACRILFLQFRTWSIFCCNFTSELPTIGKRSDWMVWMKGWFFSFWRQVRWNSQCADNVVVTIKGMEIPDSRSQSFFA